MVILPTRTPKMAAKMPHAALVPPRAVFDAATAELAGSPTVLEALKWVVVAEMLVIVRGELEEEETDVTLNDSDVLVDAKVQKLWARVSAVGSSFGHRGTTQFVSPVVNSALYGIFSWRIVKKGRSNAPGAETVYIGHAGTIRICYR